MAVPRTTEPRFTSPRRILPLEVLRRRRAPACSMWMSPLTARTRTSPVTVSNVVGRAFGAVAVLLAEHLDLGVGLVDVDGEVVELLDELLDVLRLELGEVDRYP